MEQELASLTADYNQLSNERDTLQQEHDRVTVELNTTIDQLHSLEQSYNNTIAELNTVKSERDYLQSAYSNLASEYNRLSSEAITPPYIYIYGRTVHVAFKRQDGIIDRWDVPFEALETAIQLGHQSRQSPDFVTLRTNEGAVNRIIDLRPYVDPTPFRDVLSTLYWEFSSDEAFIREVWHIVAQLTVYSTEIQDTLRYPLETLLAGGGDCEDTAILFASIIEAAPVKWDVQLVYMDAYNWIEPREVNHAIVFINTGSRQYYVETTSKQEMLPYTSVTGWYFTLN
ncbi:MAG TPA: hypothetical protein VF177_13780 [Anaerolineae bacterium]